MVAVKLVAMSATSFTAMVVFGVCMDRTNSDTDPGCV